MIGYLKSNIFSIILGLFMGLLVSIYAVNHQTEVKLPVCYDPVLFEQCNEQTEPEKESLHIDIQIYGLTDDNVEEEAYYDSLELLALCVEAEAGNQGMLGKKYVIDVILNRVDDKDFPDSIEEVILQHNPNGTYQFSVVGNGRIWGTEPTEETFQAVREELENRTNNQVLFFTSEGYSEYGTPWEKIGDHYFSVKGR